ncbi:MAG: hypothetical protein WBI18_10630 [Candidatus Saccharicenans sp.]
MKRAFYVSALMILASVVLPAGRLMILGITPYPASGIDYKIQASESQAVADAEIIKATVILSKGIYIPDTAQEKPQKNKTKSGTGGGSAPAEKTQFDVILKSKVKTDKKGEFYIVIPPEQFKMIPAGSVFDMKLQFQLPKEFDNSEVEATVRLEQKAGPAYKLVLTWTPEPGKTNKGTFAVSSKAQT